MEITWWKEERKTVTRKKKKKKTKNRQKGPLGNKWVDSCSRLPVGLLGPCGHCLKPHKSVSSSARHREGTSKYTTVDQFICCSRDTRHIVLSRTLVVKDTASNRGAISLGPKPYPGSCPPSLERSTAELPIIPWQNIRTNTEEIMQVNTVCNCYHWHFFKPYL